MTDKMATTEWSLVVAARDGSGTEARQALGRLCQAYWSPLYTFIRRQGSDPEEARDLTQAYFTELLEKNVLSDVDASKGRFRSFLFTSLRHFLSHERDRARALKRGGGAPTLSLDSAAAEETYASGIDGQLTPEEAFEYRWAMTVIARAMERLREESRIAGKVPQFELLQPYLTGAEPRTPYCEVASALDLSEGAVKVAVHRLRRRFGNCLRAELVETVASAADVDDEVRHILSVVSR